MASGAVIIGCSTYQDSGIAALRYAHQDAKRFAATLAEVCGVPADMQLLLADGANDDGLVPTRTNIVRQLTDWDRLAAIDETLFCFFSGHGFQAGNEWYLLPLDCVRGALEDTSLRFEFLLRMLSVSPARHVVLLLDACRNVIEEGKSSGTDLSRADVTQLCPNGMVTFCSCQPGRMSYESDTIESGIFTAALCQALSDDGRCQTIYELDRFLVKRIPELASQCGKPRQDAYTKLEPSGVQNLAIVSALQRNLWLAATPIGGEHRAATVPVHIPQMKPNQSREVLVAFDFGTSYSAAATVGQNGEATLVPWSGNRVLMPSVVHFLPELDYLVGAAAVEADRYRPQSTIWNAKRSLGTDRNFEIDDRSISPQLAASLILRSLRASVEEALGVPVRRCLASYPANFSIVQRNALQQAFEMADLEVVRMVGEPNAAALTLKEADPEWQGTCLVVDLGGGTFDVAVVDFGYGLNRKDGAVCEIKTVAGSSTVGGLDFDSALATYAEDELRRRTDWSGPLDTQLAAQLRREANRVKRELGVHSVSTLLLQDLEMGKHGLQDISIEVSREVFQEITEPLNAQIREVLRDVSEVWQDSIRHHDSDQSAVILLAGQGSKIFTIRKELEALELGAKYVSKYQETAVAYGLGWQASVLSGGARDILLLDLSHAGVGVRCKTTAENIGEESFAPMLVSNEPDANGEIYWIIHPDTTIPYASGSRIRLVGRPGDQFGMEMVERQRGVTVKIGTITLPGYAEERLVDMIVDVDAGNTVTVTIDDHMLRELRRFQLNNLYATPMQNLTAQYRILYGLTDLGYIDYGRDLQSWLAERYVVYPMQPVDTPIAASVSGVRLDDFVASELAILDAKIGEVERSGSFDHAYAQLYVDRAELQERWGEVLAAAMDYALSLRYGAWSSCRCIIRILPILSDPEPVAAAVAAALSAIPPGHFVPALYLYDLQALGMALKSIGFEEADERAGQLISAIAQRPRALSDAEYYVEQSRATASGRFLGDLAASLGSLGIVLQELSRPAEALPVIEEAVGIHRELASEDPMRYRHELVHSLDMLGKLHGVLGNVREAAAAHAEAVATTNSSI